MDLACVCTDTIPWNETKLVAMFQKYIPCSLNPPPHHHNKEQSNALWKQVSGCEDEKIEPSEEGEGRAGLDFLFLPLTMRLWLLTCTLLRIDPNAVIGNNCTCCSRNMELFCGILHHSSERSFFRYRHPVRRHSPTNAQSIQNHKQREATARTGFKQSQRSVPFRKTTLKMTDRKRHPILLLRKTKKRNPSSRKTPEKDKKGKGTFQADGNAKLLHPVW